MFDQALAAALDILTACFRMVSMINVKNPPALSLGENRVYFGLWAIMKVRTSTVRWIHNAG